MCCNSKTDPLLTLFTAIPSISSQIRPDPVHRFSFPVNPASPPARKSRAWFRVGPGYGSVCTRAFTQDAVAVVEAEAGTASFYDLLGIPETGSQLEIKQAYKLLARKYHPDVSPPGRVEEYTQRFIQVQEAYEILSDPNRRALYDRDMVRGLHFARRRYKSYDEEMEQKGEWKSQWQTQVSELKTRSHHKDSGNMSWGARMRRQQQESSS